MRLIPVLCKLKYLPFTVLLKSEHCTQKLKVKQSENSARNCILMRIPKFTTP